MLNLDRVLTHERASLIQVLHFSLWWEVFDFIFSISISVRLFDPWLVSTLVFVAANLEYFGFTVLRWKFVIISLS